MNNAITVATRYTPFFLNSGDHPIVPSSFLQVGESSQIEAVQVMVDRMRTALEEAQSNLTVAQRRAREYANRTRREELFEEGQEVVLSMRNLRME